MRKAHLIAQNLRAKAFSVYIGIYMYLVQVVLTNFMAIYLGIIVHCNCPLQYL